MCAIIVLGYAIIAFCEFIPLYRQKLWRDFWANVGISAVSFIIAVLLCLHVKIPSPFYPVESFINYIMGR